MLLYNIKLLDKILIIYYCWPNTFYCLLLLDPTINVNMKFTNSQYLLILSVDI